MLEDVADRHKAGAGRPIRFEAGDDLVFAWIALAEVARVDTTFPKFFGCGGRFGPGRSLAGRRPNAYKVKEDGPNGVEDREL